MHSEVGCCLLVGVSGVRWWLLSVPKTSTYISIIGGYSGFLLDLRLTFDCSHILYLGLVDVIFDVEALTCLLLVDGGW